MNIVSGNVQCLFAWDEHINCSFNMYEYLERITSCPNLVSTKWDKGKRMLSEICHEKVLKRRH